MMRFLNVVCGPSDRRIWRNRHPTSVFPGTKTGTIALGSSHAVLIQAVEIADGTSDMIAKYTILDPAGDGHLETREPLEMCTSDAFVAF
jgi:hypothetical protein